jgi:succinate dehydrogenase / fumarate reductase, membrane anchor subunit
MTTKDASLRNPLARARGLGSAKSGFAHWRALRVSALALIPLTVWFVIVVIAHLGSPLPELRAWIGHPINAALFILFIAIGLHHGANGLTEVYEDYVHGHHAKLIADLATKGVAVFLGAAMIVSVLKIAILG